MRETATRVIVALGCGKLVQTNGFGHVLLHTQPPLVHEAKIELSTGEIFGGSKLIQADGLRNAWRHAKTMAVPADNEAVLGRAQREADMKARLLFAMGKPCSAARW
jgi:hypothetical protein